MAVSLTEPLCQPCGYNPSFKVDVHLKKPLMPLHLSHEQVALEMLCLCSHLDLLIRAQVHQVICQFQGQLKLDTSPKESESFQTQSAELIDQMNQCLVHLPKPVPQLEEYLDTVGLSVMFPRVEVYIIHGSPVDMLERPPLDGYLPHIGKLNQLLVLSQQLEDDVKHLGSHKYIAHQLAVIHFLILSHFTLTESKCKRIQHNIWDTITQQVLSSLQGMKALSTVKTNIEVNFKQMKMCLVIEEGSKQEPQLSQHYMSWLTQLTQDIISTVSSITEELSEVSPVLAYVKQFS